MSDDLGEGLLLLFAQTDQEERRKEAPGEKQCPAARGGQRRGPGNRAQAEDPPGDDCYFRVVAVHAGDSIEGTTGMLFQIAQPGAWPLGRSRALRSGGRREG